MRAPAELELDGRLGHRGADPAEASRSVAARTDGTPAASRAPARPPARTAIRPGPSSPAGSSAKASKSGTWSVGAGSRATRGDAPDGRAAALPAGDAGVLPGAPRGARRAGERGRSGRLRRMGAALPAPATRDRPGRMPVVFSPHGRERRGDGRPARAASRRSRSSVRADLARVAEVAVPRRFAAGEVIFREGDDSDTCYVVRSGPRPGDPRAPRRPPAHARARSAPATSSASSRCSTTSAARPRSRPSTSSTRSRILGVGHAPPHARAPGHRGQARHRARPPAARPPTSASRSQSFQTVQSRVASVLAELVAQRAVRGRRRRRTCSSPPPRPSSPSSPAPRASRPAASSPCSSAPGVITQGRGRLTVHDPAALQRYVY